MITEIAIETKCPFMQSGGFICIKRKCAMYANDKCSIAYLPEIAKRNEEMPLKVFNALDWLNNEQGALKGSIKTLFDAQGKIIIEFKDIVEQQHKNTETYNMNVQGIEQHIREVIYKRNEDMEGYNKDMKIVSDTLKSLQSKTETLEKTLATLKKEFAEFERQMKKRNK